MQHWGVKQPWEEFHVGFDFSKDFETPGGETIDSLYSLSAIDLTDGSDVSDALIELDKSTSSGTIYYAFVQGGESDHQYQITCKVVGTNGSQFELDGILSVKDR